MNDNAPPKNIFLEKLLFGYYNLVADRQCLWTWKRIQEKATVIWKRE
jgi:hypothetical protein